MQYTCAYIWLILQMQDFLKGDIHKQEINLNEIYQLYYSGGSGNRCLDFWNDIYPIPQGLPRGDSCLNRVHKKGPWAHNLGRIWTPSSYVVGLIELHD